MDPHTLETYRQRLLALQQHIVQRIFDSAARLTAMPVARRCVSCQEHLEHRSTPA